MSFVISQSDFVGFDFTTLIETAIDHLHYEVKAQRLLVVVVMFAGNFESSSSPPAQENRDGGKEIYSHRRRRPWGDI